MLPPRTELLEIEARTRTIAGQLRLALRDTAWQGRSGGWLGAGTGNSLEFQDHRPYFPGDNPRYINWSAYARTDHYSMKLYREEVSPKVDLIFDSSASMFFAPGKAQRSWELLFFCAQSAGFSGCSVRIFFPRTGAAGAGQPVEMGLDGLLGGIPDTAAANLLADSSSGGPPELTALRLRYGSLRLLVSDLLFPGSPQPIIHFISGGRNRAMLLVPYCAEECDPPWYGNTTFIDCESKKERRQLVHSGLLEQYRRSYARHFDLWTAACAGAAVGFARVDSAPALTDAFTADALKKGLIESCV